ncbi:MAG: hypothetical protein WCX46_01545 [Candidatus Paceibacterota bacterium]
MQIKKILIIGNGQIGGAILHLLNQTLDIKKCEIYIYDNDSSKNLSNKNLKESVLNTDFIFFCIPSWYTKETLIDIKPFIKKDAIVISVSKGIENSSRQTIDKLIEKNLKNTKYALLSGPMFAKEIIENKMSFAILASKDKGVFTKISQLFINSKIKLEYSKKVQSVSMSGVLKNIYTLILSMISISIPGDNTKGFLCSQSLKEMNTIMKIMKLDPKIILGTSGLADFVATTSSEYSQNRKVGEEIFNTGKTSIKSEGLVSIPSLINILGKKTQKLPLLSLAERILIQNKNPKTEIEKYFN